MITHSLTKTSNLIFPDDGRARSIALDDHLYTITAAAELCKVSRDTIKRRVRGAKFPNAVRAGEDRHWLIPLQDLIEVGLIAGELKRQGFEEVEEVLDVNDLASFQVPIVELRAEIQGLNLRLGQVLSAIDLLHRFALNGWAA